MITDQPHSMCLHGLPHGDGALNSALGLSIESNDAASNPSMYDNSCFGTKFMDPAAGRSISSIDADSYTASQIQAPFEVDERGMMGQCVMM